MADGQALTRANAQGQPCIDGFIRIADEGEIAQLEALGVKVVVNLKSIITCSIPLDSLDQLSALDGVKSISRVHTDEAEQGIVFDVQNRRIIIRRNGQEYDVMDTKIQK